MHTVVETPGYIRDVTAIFTGKEREEIVTLVSADPDCGEVMQGTGGVRKVRIGRGGKGKSGGARVVYVFHDARHPIYCSQRSPRTRRAILVRLSATRWLAL